MPKSIPQQGSELVVALVCPLGTDRELVIRTLKDQLKSFGYATNEVRVSTLFPKLGNLGVELKEDPEFDRIDSRMKAGNLARKLAGRQDFAALAAICEVAKSREVDEEEQPLPFHGTALVIDSLKRPEEVTTLRRIYGAGFFLMGVYASEATRLKYLVEDKHIAEKDAQALIQRDENEDDPNGQRTRETFHLADVFISLEDDSSHSSYKRQITRFLNLVFGHPHVTPTMDEHCMHLAYSAALRSADLSRQVGAVIATVDGDILSVGCNDVPKFGGGQYWPGPDDQRDGSRDEDSNQANREQIVEDTITRLLGDVAGVEREQARVRLEKGLLSEITEYGRAVHAEMEALLSCGRNGASTRSAQLFTTTFPCHNCARHIVAAGLSRVVYVEPYPKSKASTLHDDSIVLKDRETRDDSRRVVFEPFIGVGPRRYVDLFSMSLGFGSRKKRKQGAKRIEWDPGTASVRVPMAPVSYIERERIAISDIDQIVRNLGESNNAAHEGQEYS